MKERNELYSYHGYKVSMDGAIINTAGKVLQVSENGYVWLTIAGRKCRRQAGRVVYEAITKKTLGSGYVMIFRDNDSKNVAFSNLSPVKRKKYFQGYDWQRMKKVTKEQQACIRNEASGCNEAILAAKYGCSTQTIKKIIKGIY